MVVFGFFRENYSNNNSQILHKHENFATMSGMTNHNQVGAVNLLLLPFIIAVVLLLSAVGFGAWAFQGRQTYKNDTDQQIAAAVSLAKQEQTAADSQSFAHQAEEPLSTYNGPEAYGSLVLKYPKTWSGYIDTTNTTTPVNAYFSTGLVPAVSTPLATYALRVQVLNQPYSQTLTAIQGQQQGGGSAPTFTTSAYSLPKVPKVVGIEVTGQINGIEADSNNGQTVSGLLVVLPLRSQTIEIWTETNQYTTEFNNDILANFSFSP